MEEAPIRTHSRGEEEGNKRDRHFVLRQILNILFMIIAIVGVVYYLLVDEMQGIIIVVIAMAFKMAESTLRFSGQISNLFTRNKE